MQLSARDQLVQFCGLLQRSLFPILEEETGELTAPAKLLSSVLAMVQIQPRLVVRSRLGRPERDRVALAAAFLAKAVYQIGTTRQLLHRLRSDSQLRRICGWPQIRAIPHESTFSRAFAEFAQSELPQRLHAAVIEGTQRQRLVGHISRDSTAIEVHEHFPETARQRAERRRAGKARKPKKAKRKLICKATERGTQIERQRRMTLEEMIAGLPMQCAIGVKQSSKGYRHYWRGYKLHLDVADGQIPISALVTGANAHDATVAIPLMTMTAERVTWLYDVMDSAYDANAILEHCRQLNHVPIVKPHSRRAGRVKSILPKVFPQKRVPEMTWAEQDRFKERTTVERVYARLKEEFGADMIRVRGVKKVFAHLAFGLLALTVDQLLKLTG